MCGIVGYIGKRDAVTVLLDGLKRLEYRGYDSAGLAVGVNGELVFHKSEGKLGRLENLLRERGFYTNYGIGHTRWATHGRPSTENAHPHTDCKGTIAVVHNGIIENYLELKRSLIAEGHRFQSETDTETIVHLIEKYLVGDLRGAVCAAVAQLQGSFAIAVVSKYAPGRIIAARRFSPLVVGLGKGEYLIASDIPAILPHTRDEIFIEDDELVELSADGVEITNLSTGKPVKKQIERISWSAGQVEKSGYDHFMLKEIHEQPAALRETMLNRIVGTEVNLSGLTHIDIAKINTIQIVACGTSYHAGLVGKYLIEALANIPVEVELASEYRYRKIICNERTLVLPISQSGETADTIAAVKEARRRGCAVLGICNVIGSSVTRLSDDCIYTKAGPEIGVASTKAFTAQLAALCLFALHCGKLRGHISTTEEAELVTALKRLPSDLEHALACEAEIAILAHKYKEVATFLYLGRWINYPVALEGALKLKEIAYINAQGYAAGEMKHGPIALVEKGVPVIVLAPHNHVYEKVCSNISEVRARAGEVIAIVEANDIPAGVTHTIVLPHTHTLLAPILQVVPLQLLAYHTAVLKGCDVDQPRNLAKSVTVE
ncbi:MAG: glutamine--fructose-6-phosphate transaminase (isomerizing) [Acidobacteriota bacterium]